MLLISAPLAGAVCYFISPAGTGMLAVSMMFAVAVTGMSPSWFSVGLGRPLDVAMYDVLPRAFASLMAVVVMIRDPTAIFPVPVMLCIASLLGSFAFTVRILSRARLRLSVANLRNSLTTQLSPALTMVVGGAYSASSTALVASVTGAVAAAEYSSASRVYVLATAGIVVVSQATQPWARTGGGPSPWELSMARRVYLVLGCVGFLGLAFAGPAVGQILFGESRSFSSTTAVFLGLSYLFLSASTYLSRQILLPRDRSDLILRSVILGAVYGIPVTLVLASRGGATGGAGGLASSEFLVMALQASHCWRVVRREGSNTNR